ncbi:MAG: condensation domain-containing protein, partial [Actinomycetota bacterium]|nr:condensation domain-containing protein [Actinomycetota bacterium]
AGLRLTPKDLFEHQTIAALAAVAGRSELPEADQGIVTGPAPLTPIQHWFFERERVSPHHFNQGHMVELVDGVDTDALRGALMALLAHHDALRLRFHRGPDGWTQENAAVNPVDILEAHSLSTMDADVMEGIADAAQSSFNLETGPLLRAVLYRFADGSAPRLLLVAHHLVVDGVSWRILLDDLDVAYHQVMRGERIDLGAKTTSFQAWSRGLSAFVESGGLDHELSIWEAATGDGELPVDRTASTVGSDPAAVSVELGTEDTDALLRGAPTAYRTRINDVLLAALARAVSRWTGDERVVIALEGHGREDILNDVDLSRTVGWFTSMFPVALTVPTGDWRTMVRGIRKQLRAIPGNGFGYGALRYLGSLRHEGVPPRISFNYLGQFDSRADDADNSLFGETHSVIGRDHDPADRGDHLIDIVGEVGDGKLTFAWYYQPDIHDAATIEAVAADFAEALRAIADDCRRAL